MTREEAEKAAATFEFPPFHAEAVKGPGGWWLQITDDPTKPGSITFRTTEQFLGFYEWWKRAYAK